MRISLIFYSLWHNKNVIFLFTRIYIYYYAYKQCVLSARWWQKGASNVRAHFPFPPPFGTHIANRKIACIFAMLCSFFCRYSTLRKTNICSARTLCFMHCYIRARAHNEFDVLIYVRCVRAYEWYAGADVIQKHDAIFDGWFHPKSKHSDRT